MQLWKCKPVIGWITVGFYLIGFISFNHAYHSENYARSIARDFNLGLLESIEYSRSDPHATICFSKTITGAYVYVLYVEKPDPRSYLLKLGDHVNGANPFPMNHPLYRYRFREDRCPQDTPSTHILRITDPKPVEYQNYHQTMFSQFVVLDPEPIK